MSAAPGVLVIDAGERSAVAACESLARAGYRVGITSRQRVVPAGRSRFTERAFRLPSPRAAPREFAAGVARIAAAHGYLAALPCSEGSLWALSGNRDLLDGSGLIMARADRETIERCTDKTELVARAPGAGLGAPETILCDGRAEALAAAERVGFPLILKPRHTVFRDGDRTRHLASALVGGRRSLEQRLARSGASYLIQRREPGPVVSVGGVFAGERLLSTACSRYLRTWPPAAGPVSFSRSIEAPQPLLDSVARLVGGFGWEGIFELELIERGGGDYAVLDFNPRIYGSLALAVKAGAPLPAIWCDWLLKGREASPRARSGVCYRWEEADLWNALRCLHEGHPAKAASILRPRRRVAHPYFRWHDPLPFAVRALQPLLRVRDGDDAGARGALLGG